MGWTSYYREPGESDIGHLRRELFPLRGTCEEWPGESRYELLDGMTVRNVFYGAVRSPDGSVWALVVLQHRNRGASRYDGTNYARKEIEESQGPAEDRCPARILDLLTDPPENDYAAEWRARCREELARVGAQPAIKTGDRFRVASPWTFADDVQEDTFEVVDGRRRRFRRAGDGRCVRLPAKSSWPTFELVPSP